MKKVSFKDRFRYWFDNKMAGGSMSLIKLLAVFTLAVILLIALLIGIFGLNEGEGFISALWNSFATVINAWMPYYDEGGTGYLILMSAAAIAGLLVTSVLIGIIASAIEEKINSLKKGTSSVIEEGHIVVLGFYPGEYTLLRQLILAAADRPCCIVVAGNMDQEEMIDYIRDNVEVPKNVRIICRTVDIFDPKAIEKCAVSEARSIIISPTDDFSTTKALLAVSTIIHNSENDRVRIGAIVSKAEYRFPPSIAAKHNVTTLQTNETLAKIIAHSCTQAGLSEAFRELFNFEGSELYVISIDGAAGLTFGELMLRVDGGVPVGIYQNENLQINPPSDTVVGEEDKILVFAEDRMSSHLVSEPETEEVPPLASGITDKPCGRIAIIGGNESLATILRELPENLTEVVLAGSEEIYEEYVQSAAEERGDFTPSRFRGNVRKPRVLAKFVENAEHVVILSDYEKDDDTADMETIMLLLHLRDIRQAQGRSFNITAEMRREHNQSLIVTDDNTDFIVASNMSSLFLAQLAESPELLSAFSELLSNEGNEIYLKNTAMLKCDGELTIADLRKRALMQGYVMIGIREAATNHCTFNNALTDRVTLTPADDLIVVGLS